ncbi:hypothetical protein AAE478_000137 [Parahypoxylon ruwenzoriense]
MAARVLLRRRVAAPFMAAALAGGALFPSVALAEAPPSQDHHYSSRKKPIYDDYETFLPPKSSVGGGESSSSSSTVSSSATLVQSEAPDTTEPPTSSLPEQQEYEQEQPHKHHSPTPTDRLAVQIGKGRLFLYRYAVAAEDSVNRAVDRAFHLEQSFTETIASLAPSRESGEKLMPGVVYVLVASMAGSIMSRNRNVVVRAAAPVVLGIGVGWLLLPVTMGNVSNLLWRYEQRVPALADAHLRTRDGIAGAWRFARVHVDVSRQYVDDKVSETRSLVESWVRKGK